MAVLQVGNLRLHVEILKVLASCIFPPLCVCVPYFFNQTLPSNSSRPRIVAAQSVVSSPDPTYERGSGDLRLIPWASLMLISGEKCLSSNHIAENTICSATPEIFGYFSTMTQHFFGRVNCLVRMTQSLSTNVDRHSPVTEQSKSTHWTKSSLLPVYCRTGFNSENLIIVNYEFFQSSQTFDLQTYSINTPTPTYNWRRCNYLNLQCN